MGDWWQSGGVHKEGDPIKRANFPDQMPTVVEKVPMSPQQFAAYSAARDLETQVKQARVTVKESLQKPKSDPGSSYRVASRQISNFLLPDVAKVKKLNAYGFTKHIDKVTNHHLNDLDTYSPKMKKMYENISKHPGLCVVYSSFVAGEGLRIFSKVLQANGWREYSPDKKKVSGERVFAFVTGQVSAEDRASVVSVFNKKENRGGDILDLMLLSGAGAEGTDLRNVMSIHIMEPYWNYARIVQTIARAVRFKSHDDYSNIEDRVVYPYIYLSDYPKSFEFKPTRTKKVPESTTDVHLYTKSIRVRSLIERFYGAMIESSIDCTVHVKNAPDSVKKKINCLMCAPTNEQRYHPDVATDMKIKNKCVPPKKTTVTAEQIILHGNTYYYTKLKDGVSIYEYKPTLDAYIELTREHPHFDELIAQLT
jgi:hypothetical protein